MPINITKTKQTPISVTYGVVGHALNESWLSEMSQY